MPSARFRDSPDVHVMTEEPLPVRARWTPAGLQDLDCRANVDKRCYVHVSVSQIHKAKHANRLCTVAIAMEADIIVRDSSESSC